MESNKSIAAFETNFCRAPDVGVCLFSFRTGPFTETDEQGQRLRMRQAVPLSPQLHTLCCSFMLAPLCDHSSQGVGAPGVLDERLQTHLPILSEPNQGNHDSSSCNVLYDFSRYILQGASTVTLDNKGSNRRSRSNSVFPLRSEYPVFA
jgi:hypothetical protein